MEITDVVLVIDNWKGMEVNYVMTLDDYMAHLDMYTMRHLISRSRKLQKRHRMVMTGVNSQRLMKMSLFRWTHHQHHSYNLKKL